MPIIDDPSALPGRSGTIYPVPYDKGFDGRIKRALTEALGLTRFGVNLTTLELMSWQRHWHVKEDEFVYVLDGELTLVTNAGERVLKAGMAAGFSSRRGQRPPSHQPQRGAGDVSRNRRALEGRAHGLLRHRRRKARRQVPLLQEVVRAY
jgi:uncharacterized cupin superfamily protein